MKLAVGRGVDGPIWRAQRSELGCVLGASRHHSGPLCTSCFCTATCCL